MYPCRPISGVVMAIAMAILLLTACGPGGDPAIEVRGMPQAAEPIAGSSQIALELHNDGSGDDVLISVTTPAALGVDIHLTSIEDSRASMQMLDELELPAGETVRFRPGGLHLMMIVPHESVVIGHQFDLTLTFERSEPMTVPVEVVDLLDLAESTFDEPEGEP